MGYVWSRVAYLAVEALMLVVAVAGRCTLTFEDVVQMDSNSEERSSDAAF